LVLSNELVFLVRSGRRISNSRG